MRERATFAAGCFWGVESAFRPIPGVTATRVGYTGGHTENPTYRRSAGTHRTRGGGRGRVRPGAGLVRGAARRVLAKHNPRSRNRQGFDIGSQYRSAIFFHSADQEEAARPTKDALQAELRWPRRIQTQIEPASTFYEAEDYHQQYFEKQGRTSCHAGLRAAAAS